MMLLHNLKTLYRLPRYMIHLSDCNFQAPALVAHANNVLEAVGNPTCFGLFKQVNTSGSGIRKINSGDTSTHALPFNPEI